MLARLPSRLLAPLARPETYRALLYYIVGLALGSLGLALVITGWSVSLCFAITPLVFPLLFGFRWAVGQLARVQAQVANGLLGTSVRPPTRTTRGASFWSRSLNAVRDADFWRQQAHLLVGWPIALIPLALLTNALELLTLPIWYRWADTAEVLGWVDVNTFAETLPFAALGFALVVLTAHLLGWLSRLSRSLATTLLRGEGVDRVRTPAEMRELRHRALAVYTGVAALISVVLIVIWALTTRGYFWPAWPVLALAFVFAVFAWINLVLERPSIRRRAGGSAVLAGHVGISTALAVSLTLVWALTNGGYFWPAWTIFGLAVGVVVNAAVVFGKRELDRLHRIEELEETRAGAVDVQETELRRIERDLHDGAQARLVALGMSLGMAEEKLRTDPEGALALLAEARSGAKEALEELRDLARGIHPPILTDRGLRAAIEALAVRSPIPVSVDVEVGDRPWPAVETAAYFVVAESLANAIKHAGATRIEVTVTRAGKLLVAEVADDGQGGANPAGNGLRGLEQRVRALDGRLLVASPAGGPTTVRAELPCE